jgi:hypothetical protein
MSRALSILILCAAAPAAAETYYVDGRGDDRARGGAGDPWRTLQHAADQVGPGDTVIVRPGTYRGFDFRGSGSEDAPVRFVGEPGAIISLANPQTPDGINLENASWVEIEGFTISNVSRAGIRAAECGAVTIRRNRIDAVGTWGIFTGFCDDLLVEDNVVSGTRRQHCVYLSNSGDRPIVRGNHLFECRQSGVQLNGDVHQGGDGVISDAVIEENTIHHTGEEGGAAINLDGVVGATIRNNLLYENRANGITLYRIDGGAPSTGNRIVNNTIVMAERSRWAVHVWDAATDTTIRNNILLSDHPIRGAINITRDSLPGLQSDHNAVIGRFTLDDATTIVDLARWRAETGQDARSFVATAEELFVDPRHDRLEPRPGSPAIDRGAGDGAPPRDLLRRARPFGVAVDIGAHEWCAPADRCLEVALPPDPPRRGRHPAGARRRAAATAPGYGPGCCGGGGGAPAAALSGGVLLLLWGRRRRGERSPPKS